MIQLIDSQFIDEKKWDQLVERTQANIQNQRVFLDSLCENWSAIIVGDFIAAMALPYTKRAGLKGLFAPPITAPLSWMGECLPDMDKVKELIEKNFSRGRLTAYQPLFSDFSIQTIQTVPYHDNYVISYNTKHNINKFKRTKLNVQSIDIHRVLTFIQTELNEQMSVFTPAFTGRLERFFNQCDPSLLHSYAICDNSTEQSICAGLICVESPGELNALFCASNAYGKKHRMMYALMHHAIQVARSKQKLFNFGGSSIPSIRYFNLRFATQEQTYYCWEWDNSPYWFRSLMKLKQLVNKS